MPLRGSRAVSRTLIQEDSRCVDRLACSEPHRTRATGNGVIRGGAMEENRSQERRLGLRTL